ncbi:DUF6515 family protein [Gaoshiqia sp. Z1-71]|uniref:DUF6515 family protein n=1 Tax=Gaoshiqia hydrogeniformans TaxID=3290090 RepID=UPI003BF8E9BD
MKAKLNFRLITAAFIFAAVMFSFDAEAQRREYKQSEVRKQEKNRNDGRGNYHTPYNQGNKNYAHKNHKKDHSYHYDKHNKFSYNHPKYGHVYRRFDTTPVKIKHSHGNYYYHKGHYYHYHHGVGYVRVDFPRHLVFVDLPFRCERVRVGHQVYYRHGDLYFEHYGNGYRLAPRVGIHISAHF